MVVDPNANGTVTIKWKATANVGAVYLVYRKLAGNNTFNQIGFVATKSFIDGSVPAGTSQQVRVELMAAVCRLFSDVTGAPYDDVMVVAADPRPPG